MQTDTPGQARKASNLLLALLSVLAASTATTRAAPLALALTDLVGTYHHANWSAAAPDPLACRTQPLHNGTAHLQQEYALQLANGIPFPKKGHTNTYHTQTLPAPADTAALLACSQLDFATPVKGRYVSGPAGPQFELAACRLRRMPADEALSCLANRRITWIGDSITVYQSFALAYWLAKGEYQHPFDVVAPGGLPSVTNAHVWLRAFHTEVFLKTLTSGTCYSAHDVFNYNNETSDATNIESMHFFRYALRSGAVVNMEVRSVRHGLPGSSAASGTIHALRWALNRTAPNDAPDLLILNLGIWLVYSHALNHEATRATDYLTVYEEVFQEAAALLAAQAAGGRPTVTRLVFKATTLHEEAHDHLSWGKAWTHLAPMVRGLAEFYGFEYYDVAAVAQAARDQGMVAQWDIYHFHQYMYAQFNDLLLNTIC